MWKLSDSCVAGMHDIKSKHMLEDDVTLPGHALLIEGGSLRGLGWWRDVCSWKNVCLCWAIEVFLSGFFLPPSFFCAMTVIVTGLHFLRQCLCLLPNSTETSTSGMSRMFTICNKVIQYV